MDNSLEYIIYGKTTPDNPAAIVSHTPAAPLDSFLQWQDPLAVLPLPGTTEPETYSVALIRPNDDFVLVTAVSQQGQATLPLYRYLIIPSFIMESIGSDIELLQQLAQTLAITDPAPVRLTATVTWAAEKRIALLNRALAVLDHNFELLVTCMDAALHSGLVLQHFPANSATRLQLIQGMMVLLPLPLRLMLTFTTNIETRAANHPRLVFSDTPMPVEQPTFDARTQQFTSLPPRSEYAAYLLEIWQDNVAQLVEALRALDRIALYGIKTEDNATLLPYLIHQHRLDMAVLTDAPVEIAPLLETLVRDYPLTGELRWRYLERLLRLTLEERHQSAAEWIAHAMDTEPLVDERLDVILAQSLETQPDAVYAFVRPHLNENTPQRWLTRLHQAAVKSLAVAVNDGDSETLSGWLKLIAREPAHYQLDAALRHGIEAALPRAAENPALAIELLTLAVRRLPAIVPVLLADENLIAILPPEIAAALVHFDATAIEDLATTRRELFLLALQQVIEQQRGCTSVVTAQLLWENYQNPGNFPMGPYHPAAIIRHILKTGVACLEEGALEVLVTAILADQEDVLFHEVAPALAEQGVLQVVLPAALEQSGRTNSDVLTLLNALAAANILHYRQLAENYVALLLSRSRNGGTAVLIEQLARLLSQHSDVVVPSAVLWMMLDIAAETKSDLMLRVALKRLVVELNGVPSEAQLAESLLRLRRATTWSSLARTVTLNWWREFAGTQPLGKLQKLDKTLDAKKGLEDMRGIVQTALAVRRVLGQKPLEEFARDIGITYRLLQALADGFDPEDNKQINIDTDTLRTIIGGRTDELSADVKQVLATNLRALAELIVSLAENRSKPTLLNRNDEALDRALMTGEHPPDGAVDVMKFLSGLLDGTGQHKPSE